MVSIFMMKKINNYYFLFLVNCIWLLFSSQLLGNSITISSPQDGSIITTSELNIIGTTSPNVSINTYLNDIKQNNLITSNESGLYNGTFELENDGTIEIYVSTTLNAQVISSNVVSITADIHRPDITLPVTNSTIITPTFNVEGTTSSNALVEIIESSPTNQILGSGQADGSGHFRITIQPDFSYYEEENVSLFASSNVRVGSSIVSKSSSTITINFSIQDYPPEITFPTETITVYEPTFNITGLAMADELVHLVESNSHISTTSADGNPIDGRKEFNFIATSSITTTGEQKSYLVTSNVYGLERSSNSINIIFDVYKPQVSFPTDNITIVTPTHNFQGVTEPNTIVEIYKKPSGGAFTFVNNGESNENGEFSILIQPTYTDYDQTYEFIASASINVSGTPTTKLSDEVTVKFDIPDFPPTLTSPSTGTIIYTPTFNMIGEAREDHVVNVYEDENFKESGVADILPINSGLKEYNVIVDSPQTITSTDYVYFVSTNVYELPRKNTRYHSNI